MGVSVRDKGLGSSNDDFPDVVALRVPTHYDVLYTCQVRG